MSNEYKLCHQKPGVDTIVDRFQRGVFFYRFYRFYRIVFIGFTKVSGLQGAFTVSGATGATILSN